MRHASIQKVHAIDATAELQARQMFPRWSEALRRRDAAALTNLYADDAILIPTLWPEPQSTPHAVDRYFTLLTAREGLEVRLNQSHFEMMDEYTALHCGTYTFHFEEDGKHRSLPARFTFFYRNTTSGWKIAHHHSSQIPSQPYGQ